MKPEQIVPGALGFVLGAALICGLAGLAFGLWQAVERARVAAVAPPPAAVSPLAPAPASTPTTAPPPTPVLGSAGIISASSAEALLESAAWSSGALTVTVRFRQIPGDYLFEPPVLRAGEQEHRPTEESLKAARLALLGLVTDSEARAQFVFAGVQRESGAGDLVFNPGSRPENVVTPLVVVDVTWSPALTPTPRN